MMHAFSLIQVALRYSSIRAHWTSYCEKAGISCTFHQLRQGHATELINGNVSLATIRNRLGHKNLQTTLRYAQLSDETADTEIRSWRRNSISNASKQIDSRSLTGFLFRCSPHA